MQQREKIGEVEKQGEEKVTVRAKRNRKSLAKCKTRKIN